VLAGERVHGPGGLLDLVVDGVVGDVLADALLAAAPQPDDGGLAGEGGGDVADEPVERVGLDDERQFREALVGAQVASGG